MYIKPLHPNFKLPTRGSEDAGAYDIYMPESGVCNGTPKQVGLGFATAIPAGYVALVLPRSGVGSRVGIELNNTCGVIDADYRGEWFATLKTKSGIPYSWSAGERLLQFILVPVAKIDLYPLDELPSTERGEGGLGSTGK